MITTPTVFILGAGASVGYGFPTARMLRDEILYDVCSNAQVYQGVFEPIELSEFCRDFRESDELSIDAFLETRKDFLRVAKYSIAQRLIQRENRAALFEGSGERWYQHLADAMRGPTIEAFADNKVAFVTFNYDRSLEEYLMTTLCRRHKKHPDEIAHLFDRIPVIHVHGKLGGLLWQTEAVQRPYSQDLNKIAINKIVAGLKIVHDEIPQETTDAINKVLNEAQRVYYLGLSYHHLNMKKLGASRDFHLAKKQPYGTRVGLTEREARRIEKDYAVQLMLGQPKSESTILPWLREFIDLEY